LPFMRISITILNFEDFVTMVKPRGGGGIM
jgi:hypothetical protein